MLTDVGPVELWATRQRRPSAAANPQGLAGPRAPRCTSTSLIWRNTNSKPVDLAKNLRLEMSWHRAAVSDHLLVESVKNARSAFEAVPKVHPTDFVFFGSLRPTMPINRWNPEGGKPERSTRNHDSTRRCVK